MSLDWIGTVLCLAFVTFLILPLQWGGNTKPWKSALVIVFFILFGIFFAAFLLWEHRMGDKALLPLHFFKNRTQIGCSILSFWMAFSLLVGIYYLPLYYQAKVGR